MGCCSKDTQVKPLQEGECGPEDAEDDFHGPLDKRSCTDIPFLLLLLACIGGMGYVGYLGYKDGNPFRFLYGMDSWGNICDHPNGVIENVSLSGQDMTGLANVFYFKPVAMMQPSILSSTMICVRTCPTVTMDTLAELADFARNNNSRLCRYDVAPDQYVANSSGACPPTPISSSFTVLNRCVPKTMAKVGTSVFGTLVDSAAAYAGSQNNTLSGLADLMQARCKNAKGFFTNSMDDLNKTWKELLYMCAISVGVAFVVTFLLSFLAAIMVYTIVIGCALGCLAAAAYCWYNWYTFKTELDSVTVEKRLQADTAKLQEWLIYASVVSAVALLVILVLIGIRKQIKLVVQLFREAGKSVRNMPMLLSLPLWTLIVLVIFLGALGYIGLFIITAGKPTIEKSTGHVKYNADETMFYLKWFYMFGILWVVQFVYACEQLVIAGSVAKYYFTRDKKSLGFPICDAIRRLISYHLGSAAFGSFIIALIQLARMILMFIEQKLRGRSTKVVKFLLKCLQCCLWCFEKFMKFINRNAYIMIAIYGTNFCRSAQKAFSLIVGNAVRVGAINSVGTFTLFLGKVGVTAIVVAVGLELLKPHTDLCYFYVPLAVAGAFAYCIAHCFMVIYGMAIDTIFVCFCEDCSRNDGITRPYFMEKGLLKFVDNSKEAMEALEARDMAGQRAEGAAVGVAQEGEGKTNADTKC